MFAPGTRVRFADNRGRSFVGVVKGPYSGMRDRASVIEQITEMVGFDRHSEQTLPQRVYGVWNKDLTALATGPDRIEEMFV